MNRDPREERLSMQIAQLGAASFVDRKSTPIKEKEPVKPKKLKKTLMIRKKGGINIMAQAMRHFFV